MGSSANRQSRLNGSSGYMHTCTKNSTAWALVVVWVLALTISIHDGMFTRIPMEYEAGVKEYNSEFEYQRKELSFLPNKTVWEKEKRQVYQVDENLIPVTVKACKIMVSDMHYKTLQVVYFVVCYLLPSLIMVVCYGLILRKLFTRRLMTQLKRVVSRTAKRLEATRRRHTINIILLVGVYIALWGPYLTYKLFLTFKTTKDILDAVAVLNVLKFLTYICTTMNPLIYMMSSGILKACCGKFGHLRNIQRIYHDSRARISDFSNSIRMNVYKVTTDVCNNNQKLKIFECQNIDK